MYSTQPTSIFSTFSNIFALNKASAEKPAVEMRSLNDDEVRAVAGGPELEVGAGT